MRAIVRSLCVGTVLLIILGTSFAQPCESYGAMAPSNALPSNCGTYIYKMPSGATLSRYFGELQNGLPQGVGVNKYLLGTWENYRYVGEFKEGIPHGMGIFYDPNEAVVESGRYEEGSLVTKEYIDPNSFNRIAQGSSASTEAKALDPPLERVLPPDPVRSADSAPLASPAPVAEPSVRSGDSAVGHSTPQVSQHASEGHFSGWIPLGIGIFIALVIWGLVSSTRCPKCNEYFVKTDMGSNLVDRKNEYKTVTRTMVHRNNRNEQTGTTEIPVQIVVSLMTYQDNFKCSKCNHTWHDFRREEQER